MRLESADRAAEEARAAAGIALQLGQLDLITECYDELARALRAAGRESDALAELHEGLLIATGGEGIDAANAPLVTARLVVRMAEHAVQEGRREDGACYVRAVARWDGIRAVKRHRELTWECPYKKTSERSHAAITAQQGASSATYSRDPRLAQRARPAQ